jgi:hypothetical protein
MRNKLYVLIFISLTLLLGGCIAVEGQQPPTIQNRGSPLANYEMQPVSPLLLATGPQNAPMPPISREVVAMGANLRWLPIIQNSPITPCRMDLQALRFYELMRDDPLQKRRYMYCDARLVLGANYRAQDMNNRRYFSHTDLDGRTPNDWALQFGCKLPSYYGATGNNIESIALNYPTPELAYEALKESPNHRAHILGLEPFYAEEDAIGIAVINGPYGIIYVVWSTKSC